MTPQERLKEIDKRTKENLDNITGPDCDWLIARVEQLEGALKFYATCGVTADYEHPGDGYTNETLKPLGTLAREILSTGPKPE